MSAKRVLTTRIKAELPFPLLCFIENAFILKTKDTPPQKSMTVVQILSRRIWPEIWRQLEPTKCRLNNPFQLASCRLFFRKTIKYIHIQPVQGLFLQTKDKLHNSAFSIGIFPLIIEINCSKKFKLDCRKEPQISRRDSFSAHTRSSMNCIFIQLVAIFIFSLARLTKPNLNWPKRYA